MERLIIASTNKGKIAELREPLAAFGFAVEALPEDFPEIIEDGASFWENAVMKAATVADALHCAAVADDSGLMVDALDGAPGIYSARFSDDWQEQAGESRDQRNNRKLLSVLENIPEEQRTAAYHCCMALVYPDSRAPVIGQGRWEGRILTAPLGENGFGYDPLFFDPEHNCAVGQMSKEDKMRCSHRAKAVAALLEALKNV